MLKVAVGITLCLLAVAFLARLLGPSVFWRMRIVSTVPTNEKLVALTFDDGPYPVFTPRLLDILDKYHVKATFFMIGQQMEWYPGIVRDIVRRGHVIENHTYDHPRNIEKDNRAQMTREIEQCERIIRKFTGRRPDIFRPPRGRVNHTEFRVIEAHGYRMVLWTVCGDNRHALTPEAMVERVLSRVRPGAIILLHDGRYGKRWKDVAATPRIIEALQEQGYRFVTLPELLNHEQKTGWRYALMRFLRVDNAQ